MSITSPYNTGGGHARSLTTETDFSKGMMWTDNALQEGYSKLIINYDLSDHGTTLRPRSGYQSVATTQAPFVGSADICVHHSATALFLHDNEQDSTAIKYLLWGAVHNATTDEKLLGLPDKTFILSSARVSAYINQQYVHSTTGPIMTDLDVTHSYYLQMQPAPTELHGMAISNATRTGTYTTFDNNTYAVCHETYYDTNNVLRIKHYVVYLWFKLNNLQTGFTWTIKQLTPNDITAVQAVNYGYNMLKDEPYTFTNSSTNTGTLLLDGIIPKDSQGNVITSTRLGAEITFNLAYRYPTTDTGKQYVVSWELQDLSSDSETTLMLRSVRKSPAYNPGDSITITTTQNTYKQFSLICKVYYKTEVDALTYESDVMDSVKLTPINTITLAFYYLTDDKADSSQNLGSPTYDIATATGMCTWLNRLVLWGVTGCTSTLWMSEVNDPSYFPYPNNIEIFDNPILYACKYKQSLLVFTESAIYQLSMGDDGLTVSTKCIQERLMMSTEDASSIVPVQSMVHFKSGNYYYLIVPGAYASNSYGELVLAPITTPMNDLFDNFQTSTKYILDIVTGAEHTYTLQDWYCFLEDNNVVESYKFCYDTDKYIDLQFLYSTKNRTWSIHTLNTTQYRMAQYISSATSDSVFVLPRLVEGSTIELQFIQATPLGTTDLYALNGTLGALNGVFHYIDTGYRALTDNGNAKKKWREVRFNLINTDGQNLRFLTEFRCDNDLRKDKYSYEYDTDPDTNTLTVTPVLEDYDETGTTQNTLDWANAWDYDAHHFPDTNQALVRVKVNAKGRLPRFVMADQNTSMFELRSVGYIYRMMTVR